MKRLILFLVALVCAFSSYADNASFLWAKGIGSQDYDQPNSIAIDKAGNVYIVGAFDAKMDFDPGPAVSSFDPEGDTDIFITKFDAAGNFKWAKRIGAQYADASGIGIAIGAKSNRLYITGAFGRTTDFDPGSRYLPVTARGYDDGFVMKMDTAGNFTWVKHFAAKYRCHPTAILLDANENIFTVGTYDGDCYFDTSAASHLEDNAARDPIFACRMDSAGRFVWAQALNSDDDHALTGWALDGSDNVYLGGSFNRTMDFDPGPGTFNMTSTATTDAYVLKLNGSGDFVWAKRFGGNLNTYVDALATDKPGNVYFTGTFSDVVDFDPNSGTSYVTAKGSRDAYICKLTGTGGLSYIKDLPMSAGNEINAFSLLLDSTGSMYIAGDFDGTVDFDPNAGKTEYTSQGQYDAFVTKLSPLGNHVWTKTLGGGGQETTLAITVDRSGNLYFGGIYQSDVVFDPATHIDPFRYRGGNDIFFAKIKQNAVSVHDLENEIQVRAYPNPTTGTVHLELGRILSGFEVGCYNPLGQHIANYMGSNQSSVDLKLDGAPGLYFIELRDESGASQTLRVLKNAE